MITGPTWPDSGAAGLFLGCFHTGHNCFATPSPLLGFHIIHFVLYLITITYEHRPILNTEYWILELDFGVCAQAPSVKTS